MQQTQHHNSGHHHGYTFARPSFCVMRLVNHCQKKAVRGELYCSSCLRKLKASMNYRSW